MRRSLVVFLLLAASAAAQVQVRALVQPETCVVGEDVLYGILVTRTVSDDREAEFPRPSPPAGDGYAIAFRDEGSRGTEVRESWVGGRRTRVVTVTHQFVFVVRPERVGGLVLPGFDYQIDGATHRVPPVALTVLKEAPGNRFVSVAVTASTDHPYVNEPVKLTYRLVSEKFVHTGDFGPELEIPWASTPIGFHAEPEPALRRGIPVSLNGTEKFVNGYRDGAKTVIELERTLYPIAPGRIELGGTRARLHVATRLERGIFSTRPANRLKAVVETDPILLEVKEAPLTGRPRSFTGIVGEFALALRLSSTRIRAGDGVTLTLEIRGRGAVGSIEAPALTGFDEFDVYPPDRVVTEQEEGVRTMTFSWLLVPRSRDVTEVPRFEVAWFRPSTDSYETASIGPVPLVVTGDVEESGVLDVGISHRRAAEIRLLSEGVRPLKESPGRFESPRDGAPWGVFLTIALAPLLSWFGTAIIVSRRRRLAADHFRTRSRRASKMAAARLVEARDLMDRPSDFHARLGRTLAGFIADRLSLPPATVSAASAAELLEKAGMPKELGEEVRTALERCDARAFGGAEPSEGERRNDLEVIEGLIRRLDRRLGR